MVSSWYFLGKRLRKQKRVDTHRLESDKRFRTKIGLAARRTILDIEAQNGTKLNSKGGTHRSTQYATKTYTQWKIFVCNTHRQVKAQARCAVERVVAR